MAESTIFDVRLYNIIILGVGFLLLFTAFQTASMAEQSVLSSEKKNTNGTFTGDGYTSLSIIYVVFSAANWIAPPIVAVLGPKLTMFSGSILYFVFILSFLKPMVWALYLGSVLVGLGAAILWTAQGNFLTINSDSDTVSRNSGIFWALLQCSLLFGNIYSYFVLKGSTEITDAERTKLFIGLSGAALLGVLSFLLLRKPVSTDTENLVNLSPSDVGGKESPLQTIKRAFYLLRTKEIMLLSLAIAYTGIELTFFSGVYGTCISNTPQFGDTAKGLIGISGMFIGVGEILGGAAFGLLGKRTNKYGRDPIVLLGFLSHMTAFFLIFMNIPNGSPKNAEDSFTYMTPNQYVAIFSSFLLGFGDSSFNTQLYSILGFMFPEDSSPAFALFKFVQSIAAAAAFYYSEVLKLHYQLLILTVLGAIGTLAFCVVEWGVSKAYRMGYQSI